MGWSFNMGKKVGRKAPMTRPAVRSFFGGPLSRKGRSAAQIPLNERAFLSGSPRSAHDIIEIENYESDWALYPI